MKKSSTQIFVMIKRQKKVLIFVFVLIFVYIDILLHKHLKDIKTLSLGTNILRLPGKNMKINS